MRSVWPAALPSFDGRVGRRSAIGAPIRTAMRRAAPTTALAATLLAAALFATALLAAVPLGRARSVEAQATPLCAVSGAVAVSPKLTCVYQPVVVDLRVRPICPGGDPDTGITSVTASLPLPDGIVRSSGEQPGTQANDGMLSWSAEFEAESARAAARSGITFTHAIVPLVAGTFAIGDGARIEIVDQLGRTVSGPLEPAMLDVSRCAGTARRIYIPVADRMKCVPSGVRADIVLLVDRSTSMGGDGVVEAGRRAGPFLDSLDFTAQRVGVVAFDQRAEVVAPLGSSRGAVDRALRGLAVAPGTRLDRAIRAGKAELDRVSRSGADAPRRRVLAIVSDGVQTGPYGTEPVIAAATEARESGIRVATMALGPVPDRALLTALSSDPRGPIAAERPDGLEAAYRALASAAVCGR